LLVGVDATCNVCVIFAQKNVVYDCADNVFYILIEENSSISAAYLGKRRTVSNRCDS
jgi:hypothetical protein